MMSIQNKDNMFHVEVLLQEPSTATTADTLHNLIRADTLSILQRQLLALHRKSNHCLSRTKIQELATQRHYPKNVGTFPCPVCATCLYGKAHKRPWRTKGKKDRPIWYERQEVDPPNSVSSSTDTFGLLVPSMIPQLKGTMMIAKYTASTVFAEHESNTRHVHLQVYQTTESAIEAKEAWEREMARHGKKIARYHVDNGIFSAKGFKQHV